MSTSSDSLSIVGEMADKIKNNVKEQVKQFSWKMSFPKDLNVEEISTSGIMILNKQMKRVRSEFVTYPRENAIMIAPQTQYKPDQEYFFCAKYRNKEICIAFTISKDHELNAFDQKTSLSMMNRYFKREAKKAIYHKEVSEKTQSAEKEKVVKQPDVIE